MARDRAKTTIRYDEEKVEKLEAIYGDDLTPPKLFQAAAEEAIQRHNPTLSSADIENAVVNAFTSQSFQDAIAHGVAQGIQEHTDISEGTTTDEATCDD